MQFRIRHLRDNMASRSKWLDAPVEQQATLHSVPSCLSLCDLKSDNYYKLVAVDIVLGARAKLKVFKGTAQVAEQGLPGIPSAIETIYIDETEPKNPILAVAVGPSVLFYRNMKPYFKFTVPGLDIDPLEVDIWRKLAYDRPENAADFIEQLRAGTEICNLTATSQKLLNMPEAERKEYIHQHRDAELKRFSPITVMTKILKSIAGDKHEKAVNCLVVGTENGDLYILDCQTFSILQQAKTNVYQESPILISANGQWDTEYRIVVASRQGYVSILRKGWLEGKHIIRVDHPFIGLSILPIDQTIVFVCSNQSLQCYSKKGKRLSSVKLPAHAICMTPVTLPHLGLTMVCVALEGGLVQLYSAKKLVDESNANGTVCAVTFGRLGQEDHVLVLNTVEGSLLIKILKRTANFSLDINSARNGVPKATRDQLNAIIPKKNHMFVEQMEREQGNAAAIYHHFQADMWRMRLLAARSTLDVISQAETTLSGDIGYSSIKLAAEVLGYGPEFILKLRLENLSVRREASNMCVLLHANKNHYVMDKQFTQLPPLLPNFPVAINFKVVVVTDPNDGLPPPDLTLDNATIKCIVYKSGQSKPLIAATVSMPMPEPNDNEPTLF